MLRRPVALPLLALAALTLGTAGCSESSPAGGGAEAATTAAKGAAAAPGATAGTPDEAGAPRHKAAVPADDHAWDYPSIGCRANGDSWLACVRWQDRADQLEVRSLAREDAHKDVVYRSPTRILGTAAAVDGSDALHLVWSEQVADGWDLRTLVFGPPAKEGDLGAAGEPVTLLHLPDTHLLWPVLAEDSQHALLLACIALDGRGPALLALGRREGLPWSAPVEVSTQRVSNWSPAATSTGPGRFALAWDSATDGDYDVLYADLELGKDGTPAVHARHRVTDTPRREAHPSLAFDGGRLYVAYDVGPEHWGREGSSNKLEESLHGSRQIEIVCVQDGQVAPLAVQPLAEMNDILAANCELPRLAVESTGNLVMLYRGLPLPPEFSDPEDPTFQERAEKKEGGLGWRTSIWFTYMTRFDGKAWHLADKHHLGVPGSEGRADAGCALTLRPGGGVAYAVVGDGREVPQLVPEGEEVSPEEMRRRVAENKNWWRPVTGNATSISNGMIKKGPPAVPFALGPSRPLLAPREPVAAPPLPQRTLPDGTTLTLALGDLHRHTDLSRCSSNWDGPIEDALRYAYDVAPLQFLAITDHFEHMTAYDWWRSGSMADAYDAPGRLADLRAYERSEPRTGHRNLIARGSDLPLVAYRSVFDADRDTARADTGPELWPLLDPQQVLAIPHTPAGMFPNNPSVLEWSTLEPRFDRLVEVFQSYRGSSEASDAPRAIPDLKPERYVLPNLGFGMHFGLIASSDHQTSDGAFAGTWVTELTRAGVFDALHARRTFASTVRAALWTEWNGVPMGVSAAAPPPGAPGADSGFVVEVDGFGRQVALLELVIDGTVTQTRSPTGSVVRETFPLGVPAVGSRFAYVRVTFADGELMWSSPIRLSRDGAQGSDGLSGAQVEEQRGDVWDLRAAKGAGNGAPGGEGGGSGPGGGAGSGPGAGPH